MHLNDPLTTYFKYLVVFTYQYLLLLLVVSDNNLLLRSNNLHLIN